MNDFRSFVRYLAPGLTFIVELMLLLMAANAQIAISLLDQVSKSTDVGSILGGVLAFAGLGYLFSMVHHYLCWSSFGIWYLAADLRGVITRLQVSNLLSLERQDSIVSTPPVNLSQAGAWRVVSALWHSRRESSERIKGASARADSLSDLMHGTGTALVACAFSVVVAIGVAYETFDHVNLYTTLPAAVILLIVHWMSYRYTGSQSQGFAEMVLFEELQQNQRPPLIYKIGERELAVAK